MIFPEPMRKAVVAVLEEDATKLSRSLLDLGVVHFSRVDAGANGGRLGTITEKLPETVMAELRRRIENILSSAGSVFSEPQLDIDQAGSIDPKTVEKRIDSISGKLQDYRTRQGALESEIRKLQDMKHQMELFGDVGRAAARSSSFSFLDIRFGTVADDRVDELEQRVRSLSAVIVRAGAETGRTALLVVHMKRDESAIADVFGEVGWLNAEIPSDMADINRGVTTDFDGKIARIRSEQAEIEREATEQIDKVKPELMAVWASLRVNELLAQVRSYFSTTDRTVLFSGWVPGHAAAEIESAIRTITGNRFFIEWGEKSALTTTGADRPPVKLDNPRFLAPFQMLVENFSTPSYGTIDPTPFVAVTYLCMFGLMFADAGQGIILLLIGLLGQTIYRKKNGKRMALLDLISWCGGAAIVSGILFGSYFGYALLAPVWFDYHGVVAGDSRGGVVQSVYGILGITVWFGVAVISLGLVLNWINLVVKRQWISLVFDKGGIVGGWIFGAGVVLGNQFVRSGYRTLPGGLSVVLIIGIPVVLLALKAPLSGHDHSGRSTASAIMDYFMEWIVEILETFSGYLANVLSFMRVAGLGIAHASLMIAFDTMARSAAPQGGYGIASILILVLGNILVIGLEGLSAGIQSLRLNYYEFFTKYFDGSGKRYAPVTLRSTTRKA